MKNFTLKNFRVFDENGATFNLAPFTILTGCNSSGKSSFTKSWILFQEFFQQLSEDILKDKFDNFNDYYVNFTHGDHKLGSFESVLNWQSKSKEIIVEYDAFIWSLGQLVTVRISFVPCHAILQKGNLHNFFGETKFLHKSSSSSTKSLFACIKSVSISHKVLGVFFEYNNDESKRSAMFHINEDYRTLLVSMTHNLDFMKAVDEIKNCQDADLAGVYYPVTDFCAHDIERLLEIFGDKEVNTLYYQWGKFRDRFGGLYNDLIREHGFKNVVRDETLEIDWNLLKHSHDEDEYGFFYPMSFMKELDEIAKEDIMFWVEEHIIEKSEGEWFDCEKFRNRIYYIFNKFKKSCFNKFSEFWSYYELAVFKDCLTSFGAEQIDWDQIEHAVVERDNIIGGVFHGTACEVPPMNYNPFEEDWNWDEISDVQFFDEMLLCLNGFGGYSDLSMMCGPNIQYTTRNMLLKCAKIVCLEALASATDICNAQFVEIDRSNAQRIYTFDNRSTSFNNFLEKYVETAERIPNLYRQRNDRIITQPNDYVKGTFMKKWLKLLAEYDDIIFDIAPESVGVYVHLKKKIGSKTRLVSLADVGYGTTPLISMLIRIELMICQYLQQKTTKGVLFIEEPESNLHPNLQSLLTEMFIDAIANYPIKFVLETHSEYLIRKLQTLVGAKKVSADNVSIYYMANPDPLKRPADEPQVKYIQIKENGGLTERFGTGFFDEAAKMDMEIIRNEMNNPIRRRR